MAAAKYFAALRLPYPVELEWVSATDKRTRGVKSSDKADHRGLDGQRVPIGEYFTDPRNGDKMRFPGDTSNGAKAESVCNCRCTIVTKRIKK
jgi:hypothetical protein